MTPAAPTLHGLVDAVVIGASAGGVEALMVLLPALSAQCPVPVFVVLHLPRQRPSLLVSIFEGRCRCAVREAQDKEPPLPGVVYFAPPDYHLLLDRGVDGSPQLALSADDPVHFSRPSIDVLFESAADLYGRRLLGMVLTGGNQDGAAGLAAVHRAGGLTAVQRPDTAVASLMPESALKQGPVDFVMTLEQLACLLKTLEM